MRYAWAVVAAAAVLASLPLVPRTARACTCPSSLAWVVWPRDGATDLARDTPLVISHYDSSDVPSSLGYALVRADGSEIALSELERLPAQFEGCGSNETVFLRPRELLDEGVSYTLSLSGFAPEYPLGTATFTVGADTFTPQPLQNIEILYLLAEHTTPCMGAHCEIAELLVDLGAPTQEPRWLVVETAAVVGGKNAFRFSPAAWSPPANSFDREWQLSVELPGGGDRCVQIRLYGLDGANLLDERRCEPDRCARSDRLTGSTCGGPLGSGLDVARIPDGSCDNPPVIEWAEGVGAVYPDTPLPGDEAAADAPREPRAGTPAPQVDRDQNADANSNAPGTAGPDQGTFVASGCSTARAVAGASAGTGPSLTLALGALWLARRRRRN